MINPTSTISNEEILRRLNNQDIKMNEILKILEMNSIHQNKNSSKMSKIKAASRSFVQYTTISGFSRMWLSNVKFMQFIWLLVLITFTGLVIYSIFTKYTDYLEYDVISMTRSLQAVNATFPAITLCSVGSLTFTGCFFEDSEQCIRQFESFYVLDEVSTGTINCYRFNSPTSPGFNGIKFGTRLSVNIRVASIASLIHFYMTDNYANSFDTQIPVYANPGLKYDIFISRLVDIKLPEPYNPCLTMQDESYRQKNCIDSCIHKNFHSQLNCTSPGFYMLPSLTLCSDPKATRAIYELACFGACKSKECKATKYEVAVSSSELPQFTAFTSKTIWLDFKYRLDFLEITQVPKTTLADMLASLGGMLGIFLGSSLMSIVEILEYIIEVSLIILTDWFIWSKKIFFDEINFIFLNIQINLS